jgi:hypothetical protein
LRKYTSEILPASARFVPKSLKNGPRYASIVKKKWAGSDLQRADLKGRWYQRYFACLALFTGAARCLSC